MAAHLHDSVLQTLTLMQKRADDPREVAALARRQERELRDWLAGDGSRRPRAEAASPRRCAPPPRRSRTTTSSRSRSSTVGDATLDERGRRRSSAPPARRSPTRRSSPPRAVRSRVYAEVGADAIEAFVRDRGPGFDPADVPADRRGVRESIVGRMERHGGRATIAACPAPGPRSVRSAASRGGRRMSPPSRRIVIVDDHALFRSRRALRGRGPRRGAGRGRLGRGGGRGDRRDPPDVVLLDVHMPGGGGVEVIRGVAASNSSQRFLALSVSDAAEDVIAVVRPGPRLRDEVDLRRGSRGRDHAGPRTGMRSSRRAWPGSCWMRSPGRCRRRRSIPSSTS